MLMVLDNLKIYFPRAVEQLSLVDRLGYGLEAGMVEETCLEGVEDQSLFLLSTFCSFRMKLNVNCRFNNKPGS